MVIFTLIRSIISTAPARLSNLATHLLGLPIENPLKIRNKISLGSKKTTIPRLSRIKNHRKLENVCTAPVEHHLKIVCKKAKAHPVQNLKADISCN